MVKGEDAIRKKKNKANRKRLNRKETSSTVSARVAALIASKKRRKSGKRRMCEGMCFSLPTPEDPFNERNSKKDFTGQKLTPLSADNNTSTKGTGTGLGKRKIDRNDVNRDHHGNGVLVHAPKRQTCEVDGSAFQSKFLLWCLASIEDALRLNGTFSSEDAKPFFANKWGIEFLERYLAGEGVQDANESCAETVQIAWIVSAAADSITRKEEGGVSISYPFLLYLVPTQERAAKVRTVCKPLKCRGLHTVSLHSGASIDHQIHGLKRCEPEFLVSTPERLLELVSLKAIDITSVSLLVIDGPDAINNVALFETINSVRAAISGDPITVVFNDPSNCGSKRLEHRLTRHLKDHHNS